MPATAATWSPQDLPQSLRVAIDTALDKKALAPAVLRVTELAGYTDWVVILSARSERQVRAIADAIVTQLKQQGVIPRGTDGFDGDQWDLLDYDDFIVHVFHHPVRTHFDLESMWSDAPRVDLHLPAEVMDTTGLDEPLAVKVPEYHGDVRFGGFDDEFDDDDEFEDEPADDNDEYDDLDEDDDDDEDDDAVVEDASAS